MVIDNDLDQRHVVSGCCSDLIHIHTETSVTGHIDYDLIRAAEFGADGSAETVTHGSQTAGSQQCTRLRIFVILGSPHLMLSYIGNHDGVTFGHAIQLFDNIGTCQNILIVFHRIFLFTIFYPFYPFFMLKLRHAAIQFS